MKFSKKKEERKQDKQHAVQAISDDGLMGVTGGTVYQRRLRDHRVLYSVVIDGKWHWFEDPDSDDSFARRHGQSTTREDWSLMLEDAVASRSAKSTGG